MLEKEVKDMKKAKHSVQNLLAYTNSNQGWTDLDDLHLQKDISGKPII
jgi:hypothetical protein